MCQSNCCSNVVQIVMIVTIRRVTYLHPAFLFWLFWLDRPSRWHLKNVRENAWWCCIVVWCTVGNRPIIVGCWLRLIDCQSQLNILTLVLGTMLRWARWARCHICPNLEGGAIDVPVHDMVMIGLPSRFGALELRGSWRFSPELMSSSTTGLLPCVNRFGRVVFLVVNYNN